MFTMNRGGMESRLMDIFRHIDRNQVHFDFLENTRQEGSFDTEILALGGTIYYSGYSRKNLHSAIFYIANFFKNYRSYDVVHIHESYLPSFNMIVVYFAKKYNNTVVIHSRNANGPHVILHNLLKHYYYKKADFCFACSKKAAQWMFNRKIIESNNYRIINNAIDAGKFVYSKEIRKAVRKELRLSEDDIVLGHIGRFYEQKNHFFLIDVFHKLTKQNTHYKLVLVGEGPLKKNVQGKIKEYGIESKVLFLGVRKDVSRLYQAFDMFLLPSLHEGLPGVGVEAQASGLICLFSDTITNEVNIVSELCHMLPITEGTDIWCSTIKNNIQKVNNRKNTYEQMKEKGFDVYDTAGELLEFYKGAIQ